MQMLTPKKLRLDFLIFADDLTGAIDIAVNGTSYKRPIKLVWELKKISNCDIVFCTNTRNRSSKDARRIMENVSIYFKKYYSAKNIYLKVDSFLRGNIVEQIIAMDNVYAFDYIVIDVAYPSLGRIVDDGEILIDGRKIQDTDIAQDVNAVPDMRTFTQELDNAYGKTVKFLKFDDNIEKNKVMFFDTAEDEEFIHIIKKFIERKAKILWVGSIGLYSALLKICYEPEKVFCVIGSVSQISRRQIINVSKENTDIFEVDINNNHIGYYVQSIHNSFVAGKNVILCLKKIDVYEDKKILAKIQKKFTDVAYAVIRKEKNIRIVLSGGETAMGILSKLSVSNISILGEIEKSVSIIKVYEKERDYVVVVKSGRVGDENALERYIQFIKKMV